jgi:trans-aconitate 2-methyltransferase
MQWDVTQYAKYDDQRGRPFVDLVGRVGASAPGLVVDLGCGPGNLTSLLGERWPAATVLGVDSSPEMVAAAREAGISASVGSIEAWQPEGDVVVSNAALQWIPTHVELLRSWFDALAPGAWLAWQVPGNFEAPSHALMRTLASSARWRSSLDGVLRHDIVRTPTEYATMLLAAGWRADTWETTYTHLLQGPDPVLEWVRGTGLRPLLQALSADDAAEFEAEYAGLLRGAYPAGASGTLFGFRRIFAVGHKPG